ncbi:MAG: hypothetical protein B6244_02675 [Candidatus Cloacimonetes bacterium 4572_55]|nr:MAG: hypothetical protein B6244_02675 [Candidatus Cloacimonetes bacterium 4572_55]
MKLRVILMMILLFGVGSHTLILSKYVTQARLEKRQVRTGGKVKAGQNHLNFEKIEKKSPCDFAGIKVNDELIAINDKKVYSVAEVVLIYNNLHLNDILIFHVNRDGVDLKFNVKPRFFHFTRHNLIMQGFYIIQWLFIPLQLFLIFFLWRDYRFSMLTRSKFISTWTILPILVASTFIHGVDAFHLRLIFGFMIGSQFTVLTVLFVFLGADRSESEDPNAYTSAIYGIYFALILVMFLLSSLSSFTYAHTVYIIPFPCALIGIILVVMYEGIDNVFLQRYIPELRKNIYTQIFFFIVCWSIVFVVIFLLIWGEYPKIYSLVGSSLMMGLTLVAPFLVFIMIYGHMKRNLEKSYEIIKEQEFLQREMDMARTIQNRLLPHCPEFLLGMESCTFSKPAIDVGGDFFDVIELGNRKIGLSIGDVSGKGLSAAFYMTRITGMTRILAGIMDNPGELLQKLNEHIKIDLEPHVFITMLYVVYDKPSQKIQVARAGHNPLLYYSSEKQCVEMITPSGAGLGVPLLNEFSVVEKSLALDDFLVLYTDGITEAMNQDGDEFGDDRLVDLVNKADKTYAANLQKQILSAVAEFTGQAEQHDDMTLLVFRIVDRAVQKTCS